METDTLDQEPESSQRIFDVFNYLTDHKKRPEANYSVAMITLDDADCVADTLLNVTPYVTDDFVVVDGGSTDGTLEILNGWESVSLFEKTWEGNAAFT